MHYQRSLYREVKVVRCSKGEIYDVESAKDSEYQFVL